MIRRVMIGLVVVSGLWGAGIAAPARAADATQPPDLTGQWRLDPKRSEMPQPPGGGSGMRGPRGGGGFGGRGGGPPGGGGWGGRGGEGRRGPGGGGERGQEPGEGAASARPVRLPDLIHVTETPEVVSVEDSAGAVLQEITTLGGQQDSLVHAPGAQVLNGEWKGNKLEIQRKNPRGGKVTTTIALEGKGDLLVIQTKMEGSGDMPAREFKRVYQRVKS